MLGVDARFIFSSASPQLDVANKDAGYNLM